MLTECNPYFQPTVIRGKFPSKTGYDFSYEIWTPSNFDLKSNKKHGLLVEIYAGPGSQKVLNSWNFGLSSHYATSNCTTCLNTIHVKLDARGSGNSGDQLMHSTYKKLGWHSVEKRLKYARKPKIGSGP